MYLKSNQGFTLAEMLVTLVVSGIMVVVLASGYIAQKRSYESEGDLRDMQMKAQLAVKLVKHYIQNAGLGAEENFVLPTASFVGANKSFSDVINVIPRNDGPDTLTVITGFRSRTEINCSDGTCKSDVIDVLDTSPFDTGYGRYLFVAPSLLNKYVEITDVSGTFLTLSDKLTVHNGDPVYRVNAYTITLDMGADGNPLNDGLQPSVDWDDDSADKDTNNRPDLYVYDNLEDLSDETDCKLVEGIEDIQFQFIWDSDGNGRIEGTEWDWQDDPTGHIDQIRAVRVWVLVRSLVPDPNYIDEHEHNGTPKSYMIANHLVSLDESDANGIDSHFDQHYHRHLSVETIMVRNRNL